MVLAHLLEALHLLRRIGQIDRNRHEGAVLVHDGAELVGLQVFLAVFVHMQNDVCTAVITAAVGHLVGRSSVRCPEDSLSAFLIGQTVDLDDLGDHESRVEAEAEMSDDRILGGVFILLQELCGSGESDLIDILADLFIRHTDTVVRYRDRLAGFIDGYSDRPGLVLADLRIAHGG